MAAETIFNVQHAQQDQHKRSVLVSGQLMIGLLFLIALAAFEIFNFDTTQFALDSFLGGASFAAVRWATILALAFCAIDFAGLLRFFLPEDDEGNLPVEMWYLMGAWLLAATMNALMTWWAVNLTLLNHEFGNEVLSRQQLLEIVPVFVAVLVWLTRILFIGAFTVAGNYLFKAGNKWRAEGKAGSALQKPAVEPLVLRRQRHTAKPGLRPVPQGAAATLHQDDQGLVDDEDVDDVLFGDEWPTDEGDTEETEPMRATRTTRQERRMRRNGVPVGAGYEQEG